MALTSRTQNALLGALGALAVGLSGYAVWVVNQPHPSIQDNSPTPPAVTGSSAPGQVDDEATTTTPGAAGDIEEATQTAAPPQETVEPAPTELTAADWVSALNGEGAALQVLGDGYGNMVWHWVQQWAEILGQERPVDIRHWGEAEDVTYNPPIVLSEGDGPALTVWSASRAESTIAAARERLDRFQDEADDADAVLVSLGGWSEEEDVAAEMDALLGELPEVPILVVIAPEGLYPTGVADDLSDWTQQHIDRVVLVDLRNTAVADASAEAWALAFHATLAARVAQDG